jgi:hypothetical protein
MLNYDIYNCVFIFVLAAGDPDSEKRMFVSYNLVNIA